MPKSKLKKLVVILVAVVLSMVLLFGVICSVPIIANIAVCSVFDNIQKDFEGKNYDCILVLGAGLRPDGSPSDMLADRLEVAIELYKMGVADTVLLSGDCSGEDYDEVSSMERYCLTAGVPSNAIVKDGAGYSTFESMLNTKNSEKNYDTVVIVTQRYHLYRAIYIADELGISADGADAALRTYRGQVFRELREIAARTKDFFLIMLYEG